MLNKLSVKFIITMVAFLVIALVICPAIAFAQQGPNVNQTDGPPMRAFSKRLFYDGTNNLEYVCIADSVSRLTRDLVITGATNATPIVITTSVAHGLASGAFVKITGVAGNTAANGNWIITVASSTTFSLNTSVGNGVYTSGGTIETQAPRTSQPVWAVQKFVYTAGNLSASYWARASTALGTVCDDRASSSMTYQ